TYKSFTRDAALGCGVGRAVFDAAQVAPKGLAIGLDLSLSKIARAIVRGRSFTRCPVREQEGIVEAEIQGQGQLNTAFGLRICCYPTA
ncbi:MAG: hypothetical protein ACREYE_15570, partial [Gammaproteobacteria bacterium]